MALKGGGVGSVDGKVAESHVDSDFFIILRMILVGCALDYLQKF